MDTILRLSPYIILAAVFGSFLLSWAVGTVIDRMGRDPEPGIYVVDEYENWT